jgi:hypothetical protein
MNGTTEGLTLQPKDAEWKATERRIKQRAKRKCERCGVADNTYEQRNGRLIKIVLKVICLYDKPIDANLRCLCQECTPIVLDEVQVALDKQQGQARLF